MYHTYQTTAMLWEIFPFLEWVVYELQLVSYKVINGSKYTRCSHSDTGIDYVHVFRAWKIHLGHTHITQPCVLQAVTSLLATNCVYSETSIIQTSIVQKLDLSEHFASVLAYMFMQKHACLCKSMH